MKTGETTPSEDAVEKSAAEQDPGAVAALAERSASEVMASTAAAIQQLAALQLKKRQQEPPPQTFEDVVRELMRPMLQNWLDGTVPKLVENVLRPELRRAFGGD